MSWIKRAQGGAPPPSQPGLDQQSYNANQPYGTQQNMYQNFQAAHTVQQQQQQVWPAPQQQQQYNQQYGQVYPQPQQSYGNNSNEFYQQSPAYNHNNDNMQQGYQQNYYQNTQSQQQSYPQNVANNDAWEDNWGWGWDDASKQTQNKNRQSSAPTQEPVFNQNANIIEESFSSNDNWNWAMENKNEQKVSATTLPALNSGERAVLPDTSQINANSIQSSSQENINNTRLHTDEVKTLNDRDVVKEQIPNLALGKRFHLENLTPQWSIESQMSQDSSDGPLTHSEGTHSAHRSENQSRNSDKSSPGPNTDSTFNYSQTLHEVTNQITEFTKSIQETASDNNIQNNNKLNNANDLSQSLSEMNINKFEQSQEINVNENILQNVAEVPHLTPPNVDSRPSPMPPALSANLRQSPMPSVPTIDSRQSPMPPPPPVTGTNQGISIPPASIQNFTHSSRNTNPPPMSTIATLPPQNSSIPPNSSVTPMNFPTPSSNSFKHAGSFSHKNIAKVPHNNSLQHPAPQPTTPSAGLVSPAVVNKISHERMPLGFGANLETAPDNSERPDHPSPSTYRSSSVPLQVPDNLEVAPQNDRNEYLQTAHLSGSDYGENTDFSRPPPTGARRMGVGQQEVEYSQTLNISGEEPPPGLARMVPGQQTETDNAYNQSSEVYMDRHIDGQPTDNSPRPYRRADGQHTPDEYPQPQPSRGSDRRHPGDRSPLGLDRMVPGEPSHGEYTQFQNTNYGVSNEQRVVTGVDNNFPIMPEVGLSEVREQNVDGSDYTEQNLRSTSRNVIGALEASNATSPDYSVSVEDQQREVTMEGENLQDLSVVSSADMSFREHTYDTTNVNIDSGIERNEAVEEYPGNNSRRHSLHRTSAEDSEGDRGYKASPRKDRDKHKPSRDRDRDRNRDSRYPRDDRKYERESERRPDREDRRSERDRRDKERDRVRGRRDRDESPESRRHRRSTRSHRYETEDTDYCSDRERDRRKYREGSYSSSKPPRPEDKDRRLEERARSRRYSPAERERRPRERYERRYRDIDPANRLGRRQEDERRRVVTFSSDAKSESTTGGDTHSSGSRAGSREATATDEDPDEPRRRARDDRRRHRTRPDPAYDEFGMSAYGAADPYAAQRQQYEYYERLRRADPAAYMRLYKQLVAGALHPLHPHPLPLHPHPLPQRYPGYDGRGEERGSVHSGRSSATGLKGLDPEGTTDASLSLPPEEAARSERMTPFKYSTAHVKGSLGGDTLVLVRAAYPADGRPAPVRLVPLAALLAGDPCARELAALPGPLLRGVTHKKSVIEYCASRVRSAAQGGPRRDRAGYALVWELLALLLRQNGVVMGSDVAELLMKNTKEYALEVPQEPAGAAAESRVASSASLDCEEEAGEVQAAPAGGALGVGGAGTAGGAGPADAVDEQQAVERLRELLIYGSQQEALEWAMCRGLWAHALRLAATGERRVRAAVLARSVAALPPADPLHSLYAARAARAVPAAADPRCADWRPHAAIVLASGSGRPDQDRRTVTQFGDSLAASGLLYSAQFCYLTAGVPFSRHPLAPAAPPPSAPGVTTAAPAPPAPPRLSLLLADGKATSLSQFATNEAIFATEIYEYAISLSQDYRINELQVYKFLLASRLAAAGQAGRALRYAEQLGRAVLADRAALPARLVAALADLADRLKYHDPALAADVADGDDEEADEGGAEGGADSGEPSPRHHQWIQDVKNIAQAVSAQASQQSTPQHLPQPAPQPQPADGYSQHRSWADQTLQPDYPEPQPQDGTRQQETQYSQYYQPPAPAPAPAPTDIDYSYGGTAVNEYTYGGGTEADYTYGGAEWPRDEGAQYADPYWQGDPQHQYGEQEQQEQREQQEQWGGGADQQPAISMPGAAAPRPDLYSHFDEDGPTGADQTDKDAGASSRAGKEENSRGDSKKGGWLGGILTKLSLRAPNQMILPDDKNPTIVWDEATKRWVNRDAPEREAAAPPPPPRAPPAGSAPPAGTAPPAPLAAPPATSTPLQSPAAGGAPGGPGLPALPGLPGAGGGNLLRMQRGRNIKKSYVDVFNPAGAPPPAALPPPDLPPAPPAAPPNYFVPAPLQQLDRPVRVSIPPSPRTPSAPIAPTPLESGFYDPNAMEPERSAI